MKQQHILIKKLIATIFIIKFCIIFFFLANCKKKNDDSNKDLITDENTTKGSFFIEGIDLGKETKDNLLVLGVISSEAEDITSNDLIKETEIKVSIIEERGGYKNQEEKENWNKFSRFISSKKRSLNLNDTEVRSIKKKISTLEIIEENDEESKTYSLIISNYSKVQNNPFEYKGISKDSDFEKILSLVKVGLKKPLSFYFSNDELTILGITDQKLKNMTTVDFLGKEKGYKNFGRIDKAHREKNLPRYSLTMNYGKKIQSDKANGPNGDFHFKNWEDYFISNPVGKIISVKDAPDFNKALVGLKIFDISMIRIIDQGNLLTKAFNISTKFYKGPIGNLDVKANFLFKTYSKASIVCIQETGEKIISKLETDYVVTGKASKSIIAIKKDTFKISKTLDIEVEGVDREEICAIVAEEISGNKNKLIIVSAHSDGYGKYTETIIDEVFKLINSSNELKGLPVLIAHDANTSADQKSIKKGKKAELSKYLDKIKILKLEDAFPNGKVTTSKTRTFMQAQFNKTDPAEDRSDFILYKKLNKINAAELKTPGPSENNPTDHSISKFEFKLK